MNINGHFQENKLTLNIQKLDCVIFSTGTVHNGINIQTDGKPLQRATSIKYLGVLINRKLYWRA